ncbi:phosphatase PAP2 family protein [Qipengyuania marisflavi]|uniref:Inositolphosphotransferase Aur1/Ipt1 domain-containing protein n=1 Tax=Qipengyuania marisflavi TaxID=2486356 RepID=A0A5S3Q1L9_9SPHN|nr:phosphatase PAP2 family protein [Qipengyuania marisflavi]TMM50267.1 hypothetical protein FEV51_03550 [Qipengyuania marisflavi]
MRALTDLLRTYWAQIPLYIYVALCGALCLALWNAKGVAYDHEQTVVSFTMLYVFAIVMFFIDIVWRLYRDRPDHPLRWAKERYLSAHRARFLLRGIPAITICVVLIPLFSSLKSMIPLFAVYDWDATFIAADRALFFGRDAWQVLQPVLGYPAVTAALAVNYQVWFLLLYPGCMFFAFSETVSPDLQRRFFLSYALAWTVIGAFMATSLASVGPAFAEPLTGIDIFRDQMAYLRAADAQIPIITLTVQDMLLNSFHDDYRGLGSGITAMPSMHIAIATLFWLAMREVGPRAGRAFFWFMVVIWVSSVHLAYHYAVDGLVSFIAVMAIWKGVPFVFAWWDTVPAPHAVRLQPAS